MSTTIVSPTLRPIYCCVPSALNPAAADIERECVEWIDRFGLYDNDHGRQKLIATNAAEVYARALPDAEPAAVAAMARWLYWGFATDDLVYDNGPTSIHTADFLAVAARLVRIAEQPTVGFSGEIPYTDALRDLTVRIQRRCTPQQRIEWNHTARGWFFGMAWDVANAERVEPPTIDDYLMMRMHTGGLASWTVTLAIASGTDLPPEWAGDRRVVALNEVWATLTLLLNDLMSFPKEQRNGDTSSNIVNVARQVVGDGLEDRLTYSQDLLDRLTALFEHGCQQLEGTSDPLDHHITGLRRSWRAVIDWGFTSARYTDPDLEGNAPIIEFPGWRHDLDGVDPTPLPSRSVQWWWEALDAN